MSTLRNICFGSLVLGQFIYAGGAYADGVVTAATEENLRAALAGGGTVTFAVDGKITVTNTLVITSQTTLDGSGHSVVISGGGAVRVLRVPPGVALDLRRLTIADGYTSYTGQGEGGAGLDCMGSASISDCTFSNNVGADSLTRGGAIFHQGTALTLNRCTFIRNVTPGAGGGLCCVGAVTLPIVAAGRTHATNCTFYANSGGYAGGVNTYGTFIDPMVFVNCTFAWNTNGGIFYAGGGPAGVVIRPALFNSVVTYTLGSTNAAGIVDGGHNICSDDSALFDNSTSLRNTDPLLGPPGDYGGPTWTLPLLVGSPATDALDSSLAPPTDQRGAPRPVGTRSDIGAFEGSLGTKLPDGFRFTAANYSVPESQAAAHVQIERLGSIAGSSSVAFSAKAGTAIAGQDFVPTNFTVNFDPGEIQKTVQVSILDNLVPDGDKTVLLSLEGTNVEAPSLSLLTILDNDGPTIITDYTDAGLRRALAAGGQYRFASNGTILLTNAISVTIPTTLDGMGHDVAIAGDRTFRLFTVEGSGALTLRHVTLTGGFVQGQDGVVDANGEPAQGGAILVNGGVATLQDCEVSTNGAQSGAGGPTSNPNVSTSGGEAAGGAIYVSAGVLNVTNTDFSGNWLSGGSAGDNTSYLLTLPGAGGEARGGAIYNAAGTLNLVSNRFVGNIATGGKAGLAGNPPPTGKCGDGSGGAIYQAQGSSLILECQFYSNIVSSLPNPSIYTGSGGNAIGAAICNRGGAMIANASIFSGNTATGSSPGLRFGAAGTGTGGAIANFDEMKVADCTFQSNSALFPGARWGGVSEGGAIANWGNLSVERSCFRGNTAAGLKGYAGIAYGGAVYSAGTCALTNVTIALNIARGGSKGFTDLGPCGALGGGIFNSQGSTFSINNTIAGNTSVWTDWPGVVTPGQGGGLSSSTNGTISVLNTILAANVSGSNSAGPLTDLGHNLSSDSSCGFAAHGGMDGTDPKLSPVGDYGGPTETMLLLPGSPALDAGSLPGAPATDQRGHARPYGAAVDIGAFESSPPFIVAGRVYGFTFVGQASVAAEGVSALTATSGDFRLWLEPGVHTITPSPGEYIFLPASQSVTTGPDRFGVDFHAFRINALSPEGISDSQLHLVFAGKTGDTFRILASTDLVDWAPVLTNTIAANGTFDCYLPVVSPVRFYRAVTP